MESTHRDDTEADGTTECLRRCEETFEKCESSGAAFKDCNEIHSGCITGCDSSIVTH